MSFAFSDTAHFNKFPLIIENFYNTSDFEKMKRIMYQFHLRNMRKAYRIIN